MSHSKEIWLEEGDLIDGIFEGMREKDGYVTAQLSFQELVEISYREDSAEGQILKNGLQGKAGKRMLISKVLGGEKALYIGEKQKQGKSSEAMG